LEKIIEELLNEYESVHSQFGKNVKRVNDDIDLLSITIEKNFNKHELEFLRDTTKKFETFVNPGGQYLTDFLEDIEAGASIYLFEDVRDLNIQLDKKSFIEKFGNLDNFFFEHKSMLSNLKKCVYTDSMLVKLNIALPRISELETIFFRFIPIKNLSLTTPLNLVEIEQSNFDHLNFFNTFHKSESKNINPFIFIMNNSENSNPVQNEFQIAIKRELYAEVLEFVSDQSNENEFVFRGKKSLIISKSNEFNTKNYHDLVLLFMFLVSGEKFLEKITMVRNVFSLYLNDENSLDSLDEKLDKIWKTIQHYFHNYIAENLKDFFKDRDSLFKEAMAVSRSINEQTDKLNSAINNSLISLVIGVTVSTYTSLAKDDIFILVISLCVFLGFSIVYYLLSKKHVNERIYLIKSQFDHFINNVHILESLEKETFREKYMRNPVNILKKVLVRFKILIICLNLSVFFLFAVLYFKAIINEFFVLIFFLLEYF